MEQFEEIFGTYYSRVFHFLYKLCRDEHLAEELTQETFFQAFTSFHRFRGQSEIFTWLAAIAKHTYYRHLRKNRLGLESVSLDAVAEALCPGGLTSPEEAVQKQALREAIRAVVDKIPKKYRDVVMLRIYANMPFAQVAKAIGISETSAKVIFFRAKKMLMEELSDAFEL